MSHNRSPKYITAHSTSIVASGPNEVNLVKKAGAMHYELRRVGEVPVTKMATYELGIFDGDELIDKKIKKTKEYGDAVVWAINTFVEAVQHDNNPS